MKVIHSADVAAQPVEEEGACGTTVRWLVSRPEGAPNFSMRLFELAPGGSTPLHQHEWEHEVFVLDGPAEVVQESGSTVIGRGDAVLVMPGELHQFRNTGEGTVRFLCMIPLPEEG